MGKKTCEACQSKCKGQAIRLQDKYFHVKCFKCKECQASLATSGFYSKDDAYYCANDYQRLFGTKCHACGKFVEGEVVTALGNSYHQTCFQCTKCRKTFGPGDKVTFNGADYLCNSCADQLPQSEKATPSTPPPSLNGLDGGDLGVAGGGMATSTPARPGQGLVDGQLGSPVSDVSDMSNETKRPPVINGNGTAVPHSPILSSSSTYKSDTSSIKTHDTSIDVFDEPFLSPNKAYADHKDRVSPSQTFMQYRSPSPAVSTASRSSHKSRDSNGSLSSRKEVDYGKFYTTSYLEKSSGSYKRGPSINPPAGTKSPHFHRPANFSYSNVKRDFVVPMQKGIMTALGSTTTTTTTTKTVIKKDVASPSLNKEEPIRLSRYPDAQKADRVPAIERDDWPAPPEPAAAYPELLREHRRRHPSRRKSTDIVDGGTPVANNGDVDDDEESEETEPIDPKIVKEIEALNKMADDSGAAKVVLRELEKKKSEVMIIDPRSASRTPSAKKEPIFGTRYESPVYASPSRVLDARTRMHSMDDNLIGIKYRSSTMCSSNFPVDRRSLGAYIDERPKPAIRNYAGTKPGYSLATKSATIDTTRRFTFDGLEESLERSARNGSADGLERRYHNLSQSSMEEYDEHSGLRRGCRLRSSTLSEGFRSPAYLAYRRSIPSLFRVDEPPKVYEYEELKVTNFRLPPDVDRNTIECHLAGGDFEQLFKMSRSEFYRLPEWKRNDMKKRVFLF